jgi:hypothetical protein
MNHVDIRPFPTIVKNIFDILGIKGVMCGTRAYLFKEPKSVFCLGLSVISSEGGAYGAQW